MLQQYNKINIQTALFIILFYFSKVINSQPEIPGVVFPDTSKCKSKGERHPRGFSDCNTESTSEYICCFLTGTNNGQRYEGCIGMDLDLFSNRSLSFQVKDISGTLICDANYNSEFYFKYKSLFYFCFFILIIFL